MSSVFALMITASSCLLFIASNLIENVEYLQIAKFGIKIIILLIINSIQMKLEVYAYYWCSEFESSFQLYTVLLAQERMYIYDFNMHAFHQFSLLLVYEISSLFVIVITYCSKIQKWMLSATSTHTHACTNIQEIITEPDLLVENIMQYYIVCS